MPRKGEKLSAEQLAKMQAARRKNQNPQNQTSPSETQAEANPAPTPTNHSAPDPDVSDLQRQIEELKQMMALNQAFMQGQQSAQGPQVSRGRLVGTVEKYSTNFKDYPDPRERLASESRLQRIAFPQNYELNWEVAETTYETRDGLTQKEPKFTLTLNRIVLDDDGEPTNGRYSICRMVFFEDPSTAVTMANANGLPINDENELDFLNEMRYLRMRDWLFECFWPKGITGNVSNKKEMAIGGKMVEYFEVNSEGSSEIPFGNLKSKVS